MAATSSSEAHWPSINLELLPLEEQMTAWRLSAIGLRGLLVYCRGFQVALSLFDFANANIDPKGKEPEYGLPFKEWLYLAGRDGALTIFHFGKAMRQIRNVIFASCPVLASHLDRQAFKSVVGLFEKNFPRWEAVRHAVAHHAELHIDPLIAEEHSIRTSPGAWRSFSNMLVGRRFSHTFEKGTCEYELSQETLERLHEIRLDYYEIFTPVVVPRAAPG
jgi:hypothetical protein